MVHLLLRINFYNIHNVFVLPYNKKRNKFGFESNLEYIGFSRANWVNGSNNDVVHAFLIDMKHLISSWVHGNCKADIDKLIADIDKYVKQHNEWIIVK